MSDSVFKIEESDIVTLQSASNATERSGYVNMGVHSVSLALTSDGNLVVEAHARGNEGTALQTFTVTKSEAVSNSGIDYDVEENIDDDTDERNSESSGL